MTYEKENKYLTEYFGKCWHEWVDCHVDGLKSMDICNNCGERNDPHDNFNANLDLHTWEGFGWLWNKCREQEWWGEFCKKHGSVYVIINAPNINTDRINPETFPTRVVELLNGNILS